MRPAANRQVGSELLALGFLGPVTEDTIARAGQLKVQSAGTPAVRVQNGIQGEITAVEVNPGGHRQLAEFAGNLEFDVVAIAVEKQCLLARPTPRDPPGSLDTPVPADLVERVVLEEGQVRSVLDERVIRDK